MQEPRSLDALGMTGGEAFAFGYSPTHTLP